MKRSDQLFAVIDFGSNSVNLAVYAKNGKDLSPVYREKSMLGIIQYIENGFLTEQGIEKAVDTIARLYRSALGQGATVFCFCNRLPSGCAKRPLCFGNRLARNRAFHRNYPGEKEAYYDYLAIKNYYNPKSAVVVDIGGASTEIVSVNDGYMNHSASIPTDL